jgi:hypothetical protein
MAAISIGTRGFDIFDSGGVYNIQHYDFKEQGE